jgi:hypothetical protein
MKNPYPRITFVETGLYRYETKKAPFRIKFFTECPLTRVRRRSSLEVARFFDKAPGSLVDHRGVAIVTKFEASGRELEELPSITHWHNAFDAIKAVAAYGSMGLLFLQQSAFLRSRNLVEIDGVSAARFVDEKLGHSPSRMLQLCRSHAVGYTFKELFPISNNDEEPQPMPAEGLKDGA